MNRIIILIDLMSERQMFKRDYNKMIKFIVLIYLNSNFLIKYKLKLNNINCVWMFYFFFFSHSLWLIADTFWIFSLTIMSMIVLFSLTYLTEVYCFYLYVFNVDSRMQYYVHKIINWLIDQYVIKESKVISLLFSFLLCSPSLSHNWKLTWK